MTKGVRHWIAAGLMLAAAAVADAQDKAAYDQRNIARYLEIFQALDRDRDGTVTWAETEGDLTFSPRFNDMDIDRDGTVTTRELNRYLAVEHGLRTVDSPFR